MPNADPNAVVLTGENPFLRLSDTDNGTNFSTNASYWRIITCPAGPGHVLYLKSELTADAGGSTRTTSPWRAGCNPRCRGC